MSGRGRGHRDGGGNRRGGRDHGRGEREFGGRGRERRGGRRDRDRDHDLEMKERDGEAVTSPTKDGERVHFKIFKNVEREKLEQQRQLDQDFPGIPFFTFTSALFIFSYSFSISKK